VARPQGGWPAALFYPFGHPTPCASEVRSTSPPTAERIDSSRCQHRFCMIEMLSTDRTSFTSIGIRRDVQRGRKRPLVARPAGGSLLKRPKGHFRGGLPAGRKRIGHGGAGWNFTVSMATPCHTTMPTASMAVSVALPHGGRRAAVFYPFG
jgi:hypothetical protein